MLTWIKRIVVVVVLLALVGGAGVWYWGGEKNAAVQFRTSKVEKGDLVAAISATGTVEPDEVIDVGSQVTGQIAAFGVDTNGKTIDYISQVQKGELVAKIDDTTYVATLNEAKAQLLQAQTTVLRAKADKLTAQAKLTQAERDWQRAQNIGTGDALAQTTYDNYQSTYEQAQAALAVSDAAIKAAEASVAQADSTVTRAQRNVDYCTIKSPVDGMVIDRRVNIGQTVVSTQSASSLFLIARDLKTMQVWVAVNEADIGHIQQGQTVTFTCDAFGDRVFHGSVKKMRLNAQMTQNVVVYTVEVTVDNADYTLLPYLTANVQFETERQNGTLMVPTGALRWTPDPEQIVPAEREKYAPKDDSKPATPGGNWGGGQGGGQGGQGGGQNRGAGGDGHKKRDKKKDDATAAKPGTVWVKDGEFVRPVSVTTGVTDGASTAVAGDLKEGDEVVTGTIAASAAAGSDAPKNPFLPQMPRGGPGGGNRGPR